MEMSLNFIVLVLMFSPFVISLFNRKVTWLAKVITFGWAAIASFMILQNYSFSVEELSKLGSTESYPIITLTLCLIGAVIIGAGLSVSEKVKVKGVIPSANKPFRG